MNFVRCFDVGEIDKEVLMFIMKSFIEAFIKVSQELFGIEVKTTGYEKLESNFFKVSGGAVVVGFKGLYTGRVLISLSKELLEELATNVIGEINDEMELLYALNEFGNMVSGNAVTFVNNKYKGANIRLSPPSSFLGDEMVFSNFKLSNYNVNFAVSGKDNVFIKMNVAIGS